MESDFAVCFLHNTSYNIDLSKIIFQAVFDNKMLVQLWQYRLFQR